MHYPLNNDGDVELQSPIEYHYANYPIATDIFAAAGLNPFVICIVIPSSIAMRPSDAWEEFVPCV